MKLEGPGVKRGGLQVHSGLSKDQYNHCFEIIYIQRIQLKKFPVLHPSILLSPL